MLAQAHHVDDDDDGPEDEPGHRHDQEDAELPLLGLSPHHPVHLQCNLLLR